MAKAPDDKTSRDVDTSEIQSRLGSRHSDPPLFWLPNMRWLNRRVTFRSLILCGVGLAVLGGVFIAMGGVNVSANRPDGWLAEHFLHFTFKRSIATRASSLLPPDDLDAPGRVTLGAQHYDLVCANCHGGPGIGQSVVALSMSPRPQSLPKVIGQFTDAELHQIVMHGVRFSAMPSWASQTRTDEVWSMVAFLKKLPAMDAKTYLAMTRLPKIDGAPAQAAGDVTLRPADTRKDTLPADEFLYAAPATGFGDVSITTNPVATCARCHGADGTGAVTRGEAPNLTIHDAAYLRASLLAYSNGTRESGYMRTIATQLSGDQITALADHYAQLPVKTSPATAPANAAALKRGEEIAARGIVESATPACANCHESAGARLSGAPHIAGQSETYLRRQLIAMRDASRGAARNWSPMAAVAHNLNDRDIAGLAAFYASLTPVKAGGNTQMAVLAPPAGDTAAAKQIFETQCVKCHENGGRGDPQGGYPNLTIQSAPYAAQALHEFRARSRVSSPMLQVVDSLSYDELASLANYVGSLKPEPAVVKPNLTAAKAGARIAEQGLAERGIPRCMNCHSAEGVKALPLIPTLAGESAVYLQRRLDDFAGAPGDAMNGLNPMPAIARKLTDEERTSLAAYFAAAQPLAK